MSKIASQKLSVLEKIGYSLGDLAANLILGDANHAAILDAADAYVTQTGLDLPPEPDARKIEPNPDCVTHPVLDLHLANAGISAIVWATGYTLDCGWLKPRVFDEKGRPAHDRGVTAVPGLYFLGLPWLSRRASPFIWGVWKDAEYLAQHIATARPTSPAATPVERNPAV